MTEKPPDADTHADSARPEIAAVYAADPALMTSPEGDEKGLRELRKRAQDRLDRSLDT